jgi:hypothetical protein
MKNCLLLYFFKKKTKGIWALTSIDFGTDGLKPILKDPVEGFLNIGDEK